MATKSQEILLKGNTTNASAVPSSLKVREIAINALDRSLFTNDGNSIVKLYTGTNKWFDVNGNANNALKLGGILASEYINKETFNSHINNSVIHITANERTAWNNKWDYNEATIKGVKVNAAVLSDSATKLQDNTAFTAWGQTFFENGKPKNVSGDLSMGRSKIYWNGDIEGSYISSNGMTEMIYEMRGGHSFYVNRDMILRITRFGRVLIGTATDNGYKLDVNGKGHYSDDLICGGEVVAVAGEGTPAGVTDYSALTGKPAINGVTLVSGNNTLAALGIQAAGDYATNSGVITLLTNYADKTFVSNNYVGKSAFNSHTADTDIHITAAERDAWNAKWDYNEATIKAVKVTSASSADSIAWANITNKPTTFTPSAHTHTASDVSGLPTSLKNPYALTFGSKTYDGSAAATITASDLGALTAHQSIYSFTLQVNGTSKGTYNPASTAKTINIAVPTKTSDITNNSGFITSASIPTALKNPYAVEIKANGVSLGTYDGSAAAIFNLSAANVGAANKVHTHNASEVSGLPTKLSSFTNDVGYITGITKSMVEGVLTGDITSHTHSQYLTSALRPAKFGTTKSYKSGYYKIKINSNISWMLSFDVKIYQKYSAYTIRFSGYNYSNTGQWLNQSASIIDGQSTIEVKFGYESANNLWVAIPALQYTGISITNVANGYYQIDTYAVDKLFTITYEEELSGTTQETVTLYPPSKSDHTHTFASLTSKPTTIAGYGITDALTTSNFNSYAPTLTGTGASGTWGINISGNAAGLKYPGGGVRAITLPDGGVKFSHYITFAESPNIICRGSAFSASLSANALLYSAEAHYFVANNQYVMFINSSGNVTIGTSDSAGGTNRLFVYDGAISGDIWADTGQVMLVSSNNYYLALTTNESGYSELQSGQRNIGATPLVLQKKGGNVLIGTGPDNGYKLQVNGSERVYGNLIVDGEVSALVA